MTAATDASGLKGLRRSLWVAAALALVAVGGLVAWQNLKPEQRAAPATVLPAPIDPQMLARLGRDVDDVALRDADGAAILWADLKGAPRALFFGFTHCPEICPTTMAALDAARATLGPAGDALRVDFVTIDPARDTSPVLKGYFGSFSRPVRAMGGDEAEIARLARAFRAAYRKSPTPDGGYTMDHTTAVYLIDAEGAVVDMISYGAPPDVVEAQLRRLVG